MGSSVRASGRHVRAALTLLAAGGCAAILAAGVPAHAGTTPASRGPASPRPASSGPASVAAGTITTLAGGTGAPTATPGTGVAVSPCGLQVTGNTLYVGNYGPAGNDVTSSNVQAINTATGQLSTVAGNGTVAYDASGMPATKAGLDQACGTATDAAGNLILADEHTVQVIAAKTGTFYGKSMITGHIYRVAGRVLGDRVPRDRPDVSQDDGGLATSALLYGAVGVSVDAAGNLVVAETGYPQTCYQCSPAASVLWVVAAKTGTWYGRNMTAGHIYDIAGNESDYGGGDCSSGIARQEGLNNVIGPVRPDAAGNLIIPEYGSDTNYTQDFSCVQVLAEKTGTYYGQKMTTGHIYTIAGNDTYVSSGNGAPARQAGLADTNDAVLDAAGNVVIADANQVRVIAEKTGTYYGQKMTTGDIYGIAGVTDTGYSGDGGPGVKAEVTAGNVAVDGNGNVVLSGDGRVRVIAEKTGTYYGQKMTTGDIYTVAGHGRFYSESGTPAARTQFFLPTSAAVDRVGDTLTTDNQHCVIWFGAGRSRRIFGRNVTAGDFYQIAAGGFCGVFGRRGPDYQGSYGITAAFDHWGNVIVAGNSDSAIIKVIAASSGTFYGQKMTADGVYNLPGAVGNCAPDVPAHPASVSADRTGNLLIADDSCQDVSVYAVKAGTFYGQQMKAGHLYRIAGTGTGNTGNTGDGGPARKADIYPFQAVTDRAGNVVIASGWEVRVVAEHTGTIYGRKMTAGDIYRLAGSNGSGFSGSGGLATAADLTVWGAVVAPDGNIVIQSVNNAVDGPMDRAVAGRTDDDDVVWVVAEHTGSYYGQQMTAGHIYIVAGDGTSLGNDGLGDGGPGTQSSFVFGGDAVIPGGYPAGVAVRPDGDLVIADTFDNRLRTVAG